MRMLTLRLLKTRMQAKEAQSIKSIISNCTLKLTMHIRIILNCKLKLMRSNPRRLFYKLSMAGIKVSNDRPKMVAKM